MYVDHKYDNKNSQRSVGMTLPWSSSSWSGEMRKALPGSLWMGIWIGIEGGNGRRWSSVFGWTRRCGCGLGLGRSGRGWFEVGRVGYVGGKE